MPHIEPQKKPTPPPAGTFFRKTDLLWVGLLLLAAVALLFFLRPTQSGAVAQVTVADNEAAAQIIPLDADGLYTIEEGRFAVYLQVKDGAIRFVDSQCPDHVCEEFGWLSRDGDWALCAPAGVSVRVVEGE